MEPALFEYLSSFLTPERLAGFERVLDRRTRFLTVAFENLYHQNNASACIRSCDCFGVQDVHSIESRNQFEPNHEIALGAGNWTTVIRHRDSDNASQDCIKHLRGQGYRIVATSPDPENLSLREATLTEKTAVFFGNEHDGLSDSILAAADERVCIPMSGFTDSFNISVAAAITLYELTRNAPTDHPDWALTESEKQTLREDWVQKSLGWKLPSYLKRYKDDRRDG